MFTTNARRSALVTHLARASVRNVVYRQRANQRKVPSDSRNDVDDEARRGADSESDGKWVVFSLVEPAYDEKDQVSDLWIVPADGSAKPRRLTFSKGGESGVAWSPDSRRIAFSARREGDEVSQIYVLDVADGGEAVRVTSLSTGARSPQWRPDGKALLFISTVYPGAADDEANKKIAAERKAQKYRVRVYEKFPIRNWDKWLEDTQAHLFVQDASPARKQKICSRERSWLASADSPVACTDSGEELDAVWTPEGDAIVFVAIDQQKRRGLRKHKHVALQSIRERRRASSTHDQRRQLRPSSFSA